MPLSLCNKRGRFIGLAKLSILQVYLKRQCLVSASKHNRLTNFHEREIQIHVSGPHQRPLSLFSCTLWRRENHMFSLPFSLLRSSDHLWSVKMTRHLKFKFPECEKHGNLEENESKYNEAITWRKYKIRRNQHCNDFQFNVNCKMTHWLLSNNNEKLTLFVEIS